MINMIVGVPIWAGPNIFMNVVMWEHPIFDCEILDNIVLGLSAF
jgi:hypothetical protein